MKKLILFSGLFLVLLGANAQKPSLSKAYNFYYDKDYVKAKEQIDLCAQDEKLSAKAQTWLYMGNIYYFLANEEYGAKQKNDQYTIVYPDAPVNAYDAFLKAQEINANAEAMDMFSAKEALRQLYPLLLVRGVDQLIANDLSGAKSTLEKGIASYEMDKPQYPMNGDLYYYYAYTLEAMGQKENLKDIYQKSIDDGSNNTYVYVRLMENYKEEGDSDMAKKVLDQAKSRIGDNVSVSLAEIDYYYWKGDSAKARMILGAIPVNKIVNADELVNMSNFLIKEKKYEDAADLLERANAISPNDFVVLYNLGVCNYSLSEELFNKYNQLSISDPGNKEAAQYKNQSDDKMMRSARYFESAREIEPKDINLLNTLRAIYARQQSPQYDEIDAIIKSIEK